METQPSTSTLQKIIRWLVPAAAIIAFAAWMSFAPEGALGKLDAIGYAVCHRIDARSFHLGERQLPLCARCTGEFYSAALTLIVLGFVSRKSAQFPARGILAVLFLFFLAFGFDGVNSYVYLLKGTAPADSFVNQIPALYAPNSVLRLFTGSGMGIALAAVLYPVLNQTIWQTAEEKPALNWKTFGALVLAIVVINLLILTENPIVLYPIAYLSALGTLSLLVIVFSLIWMMIMKSDNTFTSARQLALPILAGFTLALLLVLSIDFLRLNFTGTWSGFPGLNG
ncbi:MAG: DUF2085 domain-containing protein [Anaerolineales bacterium]|nr:DUF2085 domain-containing protein [Anaerolineales bacterium]